LEDKVAVVVSMPQGARADHARLERFRGELHDCFTARPDALFELVDALCQPVAVDGIAHLSLAPGAQRGHGSGYDALANGGIDQDMIRDLLAGYRPHDWGATFAVDTTTWPRPEAHCSPGRGYYHHAHAKARHVHGQPIVGGWDFSLLAEVSPHSSRWSAPMDIQLRAVGDDADTVAVKQVRALLPRLDHDRQPLGDQQPLFLFDGGYHPAQLTVALADTAAQIAVRVRDDRVFFTRAPQRTGRPGAPRRHGTRFHCAHPASWPTPHDTATTDTLAYGHLNIQAWHQLHPERPGIRDRDGRPAIIECTLIRITVDRLPPQRRRGKPHPGKPHPIWLWWAGPPGTTPDLLRVATAYLHRFDIEHTIRFAKQTLGLTTPKIRTPEQAQRWSWLILAAYTQLRLGARLVGDHRLRWQPPQTPNKITPGRVRTGFGHLLPTLGTPTSPPKTCTPGPGRPKGRKSAPAPRHPIQKVPTSTTQKTQKGG
jgi:hypothetical protein